MSGASDSVMLLLLVAATSGQPPRWLTEYTDFHFRERLAPRAPLLVYHCDGMCGGIADRMKGVLTVFYAALMTNRTFFLHMPTPVAIESLLEPTEIDWRWTNKTLHCDVRAFDIDRHPRWLHNISDRYDPWTEHRVVCVRLNLHAAVFRPLLLRSAKIDVRANQSTGSFFGTAFRSLFRPSALVRQRIADVLSRAGLPAPACYLCLAQTPWIAGHIRTGDANFGRNVTIQTIDHHLAARLGDCLLQIIGNRSGYIASDSMAAKIALHERIPAMQFVDFPLVHFDRQRDADHSWAWAELFIIAHAPCIVAAKYSGYSLLASYMAEFVGQLSPRCFIDSADGRCGDASWH